MDRETKERKTQLSCCGLAAGLHHPLSVSLSLSPAYLCLSLFSPLLPLFTYPCLSPIWLSIPLSSPSLSLCRSLPPSLFLSSSASVSHPLPLVFFYLSLYVSHSSPFSLFPSALCLHALIFLPFCCLSPSLLHLSLPPSLSFSVPLHLSLPPSLFLCPTASVARSRPLSFSVPSAFVTRSLPLSFSVPLPLSLPPPLSHPLPLSLSSSPFLLL